MLQVRSVHHLHLKPRDGAPVEQAVRVNEVGSSQDLDGANLVPHSLKDLGIEVHEDLQRDVRAPDPATTS